MYRKTDLHMNTNIPDGTQLVSLPVCLRTILRTGVVDVSTNKRCRAYQISTVGRINKPDPV